MVVFFDRNLAESMKKVENIAGCMLQSYAFKIQNKKYDKEYLEIPNLG